MRAKRFTDPACRPSLADISGMRAPLRTSWTNWRFSASVQLFGFNFIVQSAGYRNLVGWSRSYLAYYSVRA